MICVEQTLLNLKPWKNHNKRQGPNENSSAIFYDFLKKLLEL